ncbi:FecCD family ABC transporter permease [Corynebacterium pelargi]|uniref:Ferric enterobactin transport system permease protein FepG n=1 Tax=Corynebacterium pelargi TaxID=1471400 RepID=A0A410WB13_9CORY|nr:iron chelate uptake ABC transporter family permease subunit [Corynebacterium pelargi]QAU53141.1 Ferric enterobactin transport system permease protein FepG [Corynebacterium pelargi]GGG74613.1 iron-enterobactin transporter permease [Corynebacterium pelargi]
MSQFKTVSLGSRRPITVRIAPRSAFVALLLAVVICVLGAFALVTGEYHMTIAEALRALAGNSQDRLANFFVQQQRAPRVLAAIIVGAALGVSGTIFQSLSDNPLGSPDVIGFSTGAATGALLQIIVFSATPAGVAVGALCGGLVTAMVVYGLSYESTMGVGGVRLVLVGIGVSAILHAVNSLLIVRASLASAQTAALWLAGTLNAVSFDSMRLYVIAIVLLLPMALMLSRPLNTLSSGDDIATSVGVKVRTRRSQLVAIGVALIAAAVAIAGPVAFVALAAPQIAKRLARSGECEMIASGLCGAMLVLGSDIAAQRLFAPTQLPVGAVTGTLGGVYLVWLLVYQSRRSQ